MREAPPVGQTCLLPGLLFSRHHNFRGRERAGKCGIRNAGKNVRPTIVKKNEKEEAGNDFLDMSELRR